MEVVKLITNDDGDLTEDDSWHWVDAGNRQGKATLCTGEFFGFGESPLEFEYGEGEITCPQCIAKLRTYRKAAVRAGIR